MDLEFFRKQKTPKKQKQNKQNPITKQTKQRTLKKNYKKIKLHLVLIFCIFYLPRKMHRPDIVKFQSQIVALAVCMAQMQ